MTQPPAHPGHLVLVAGAGRSGTSTMAGSLVRLGLRVPQPEVPADESNPRGFFEPQWVVDLHKQILQDALVRTNDSRPEAARLVAEQLSAPDLRARLLEWLSAEMRGDQVVVKDPRLLWMHELWRWAAGELGVRVSFVTMLRHPAEVARSRDMHYLADQSPEVRIARETSNIAGWCNALFVTVAATNQEPRSFVRYEDVISDWRSAFVRLRDQIDVQLDSDLSADRPHPVDDFLDVSLRRSGDEWEGLQVAPEVRAMADECWECANRLVDDPYHQASVTRLAELAEDYERRYNDARALVLEHTAIEVAAARRELRRRHRQQQEALKAKLAGAGTNTANGRAGAVRSVPARVRAWVRDRG